MLTRAGEEPQGTSQGEALGGNARDRGRKDPRGRGREGVIKALEEPQVLAKAWKEASWRAQRAGQPSSLLGAQC